MKNYNKINVLILVASIVYTIGFGIYYSTIGNLEFVWYVGVLSGLIVLMVLLHKKFKFSSLALFGASLWGLLHMVGGAVRFGETRLYDWIIINVYSTDVPGMEILKYDQFMHFYTYIIVVVLLFYIIKPYLNKNYDWLIISTLLVFTAVGVGGGNEIIEFVPALFFGDTGVGGYTNTLLDLVFNTLGAIVGVIYLTFVRKKY